jgi:citrate lyase subunit beta/citryl-CoA lyase
VGAYKDAQARGLGVVSLGSKMIDAPVVQRALKLVQRAERMGVVTQEMRAAAAVPAAASKAASQDGEG